MPEQSTVVISDARVLAALQLIQPANSNDVFDFIADMDWALRLTEPRIGERLKSLCNSGFLHETGDMRYIVTPIGSAFASTSMDRKDRDKLRMMILNKSRYTNELRWMHG
jgi:predicted transcriptional regulator